MTRLVTIYGGSGFVGRQIARLMAKEGWRVRVACRRPNEALFVKPYGAVGQVEPIFCNVRDDASVAAAMAGADAVVNCVGTFDKGGRNNFEAVQSEAAGRIARIAADKGVGHLVHISAIGADAGAASLYQQTKAEGEKRVRAAFPDAVILRPSVMFGPGDGFFNRFAGQSRLGPVLPIIGADTKFQPVYVEDVAQAAVRGALGLARPGVYELGGPDVATFRDLMHRMLTIIERRRLVMNLPFWVGGVIGGALDVGSALTLGLIKNRILTRDQVKSLRVDNVVAPKALGLSDLGITPTAMGAVLPDYLWRFRRDGQYAAIMASAKNLRNQG
ncbi:MAG TPA: complex I NDUFA9 subunit family protein [Paracoccaceae bacterium]|nr:complex I NDUFA9 subunit family protein [Paracoccaceae bacterium]